MTPADRRYEDDAREWAQEHGGLMWEGTTELQPPFSGHKVCETVPRECLWLGSLAALIRRLVDEAVGEERRATFLWIRDKIRFEFAHRAEGTIGRAWLDDKLTNSWPQLAALDARERATQEPKSEKETKPWPHSNSDSA